MTIMSGNAYTLLRLAYGASLSPLGVVAAGTPSEATLWELWTLTDDAHAGCHVSSFCRNPLHPGPCKGWKHHLGLVSPGALHALERARHDKLEQRRKDKVAALLQAGHKVPARLQKPIVYDPAKNPHIGPNSGPAVTPGTPNLTPEAAKKAVAAIPTAGDLRKKVDNRRAVAAADAKTKAAKAADFSSRLRSFTGGKKYSDAEKASLATQLEGLHANDPQNQLGFLTDGYEAKVAKKADDRLTTKLTPAERNQLHQEIADNLSGKDTPAPLLDRIESDVSKTGPSTGRPPAAPATPAAPNAPTPAAPSVKAAPTPSGPVPSAPLPSGTAAHVQNAVAIAHRSGHRAGVAKVQLEAYDKLSKAEFDALPDDTKKRISSDLANAHAKFLDPKKQKGIQDIMDRLGTGSGSKSSAPAAPSAPTPAAPAAPKVAAPAAPTAPSAPSGGRHAATPLPPGKLDPNDVGTIKFLGLKHEERLAAYESLTKDEIANMPELKRNQMAGDAAAIGARSTVPGVHSRVVALQTKIRDAISANKSVGGPAGAHAVPATFEGKVDAVRKITDPHKLTTAVTQLKYQAKDADHAKQLSDLRHELSKRDDLPTWAKASILSDDDAVRDKIKGMKGMDDAVAAAVQAPSSSGQVFTTTYGFENLLKASEKDLNDLPKPIADAVRERRDVAAQQLIGSPNVGSTSKQEALIHLFGSQDHPETSKFDNLGKAAQKDVIAGLSNHANNNAAVGSPHQLIAGSQWQTLHDKLTGKTLSGDQADALAAVHHSSGRAIEKLNKMEVLDRKDFESLAYPHRALLLDTAEKIRDLSPDPATKMSAAQTVAVWQDQIPKYGGFIHGQAASSATWLKPFTDPDLRAITYNSSQLTPDSFKTFTPEHRRAVLADMKDIADKGGAHVTLQDRYDLQYKHDQVTNDLQRFSTAQKVAVVFSDPSETSKDAQIKAFSGLSKADYDGLPKAYQDNIQEDLAAIGLTDPMAHDRIQSVITPGAHIPLFRPTTPAATASPELKAAVDTLYGIHPQSHTAAHQLKSYGALRREHFNQLNPQEQQTLLADLSYIETTSKGANKDRASKLIDRFTPPGTPPGTIPAQAIYPPSNAVVGQTRLPDPKGQTGLLVQATDKGVSGDGWLRLPGGGKGPWGQYGAAGALLRHVGPDGKERFLMVERGPGISDPGKWQFPGGAIDSKESAHQGAAREIIEELGFKANALDNAAVHGHHESAFPGTSWKYTSIAATVPTQLVPDLSTHHARAETSDAKWMTREEIAKLDTDGKLLKPLAGGALERNVLSLFPSTATSVSRPAPRTTKATRLRGIPSINTAQPQVTHHKPSIAKNLVGSQAEQDALRNAIKGSVRQSYRGKAADERLAAIGAMQGFDRTPTVKSKREIDALLSTGDYIEAWRGVRGSYTGGKTAHEINEDFRTGPAYYGLGVFGNGYYLATDKKLAEAYADGSPGSVLRVLIPKSAAIEDHASVLRQAQNTSSSVGGFRRVSRAGMGGGTLHDEGRFAAAKGLDAIEIPAATYRKGGGNSHLVRGSAYNLINRSIVIAQEA